MAHRTSPNDLQLLPSVKDQNRPHNSGSPPRTPSLQRSEALLANLIGNVRQKRRPADNSPSVTIQLEHKAPKPRPQTEPTITLTVGRQQQQPKLSDTNRQISVVFAPCPDYFPPKLMLGVLLCSHNSANSSTGGGIFGKTGSASGSDVRRINVQAATKQQTRQKPSLQQEQKERRIEVVNNKRQEASLSISERFAKSGNTTAAPGRRIVITR